MAKGNVSYRGDAVAVLAGAIEKRKGLQLPHSTNPDGNKELEVDNETVENTAKDIESANPNNDVVIDEPANAEESGEDVE